MEDKLKEEVQKEVEELWESKLKENFSNFVNSYLMETLTNIKDKLSNFENSVKSHIKNLENGFDKNFNQQISQLQQQSTNLKIKNDEIEKEIAKENKRQNQFQNQNEIIMNENNNKIQEEENQDDIDDILRKKDINMNLVTTPSLKIIKSPPNTNQLITLLLNILVNTRSLLLYYFNRGKEEKILKKASGEKNKLGPAFLTLIDNFWKNEAPDYTPLKIHQVLKEMMKNDYNTQNPALILDIFLSQLNFELKPGQNPLNLDENIVNDDYEAFNKDTVLKKFNEKYQQNPTKISNSFYNILETVKKCQGCDTQQYEFKTFPLINIFLQASEEKMFNNISFLEHFNNLLTDKNEEIIKEKCIICESEKDKYISRHILDITEIIIVDINRINDPNYLVEFKYPEYFEKKDIINLNEGYQINNYKYELFCVMKKYVINSDVQFILYCKNFINGAWYSYDNREIKETTLNKITEDLKHTCLLIYQCKRKQ